jgi:hypothetical protein
VYGPCRTFTGSPRSAPFLHYLRRPVVTLLRLKELCSTASQVLLACPTSRKCTRRDFGLDLPRPDCLRDYTTAPSEISRFPLMKLMHMPQVSDSGEPNEHSLNALTHIAFPIVQQGRRSRTVIILRLCTPLLTLPHAITGRRGIARGRSGSLLLSP